MPIEIPRIGSLWRARPQTLMDLQFAANRHLPNQFFRIGHIESDGMNAAPGTEVIGASHVSTWRGTIRRLHELFLKVDDKEMAA